MRPIRRRTYPSDLDDHQWTLIKNLIPKARTGGRPRRICPRAIVDAILYLVRTGCSWRYLPRDFPPWRTIYDYFSFWRVCGAWRKMHLTLAQQVRIKSERNSIPSTVIIDGQAVRAHYGEERGYDGFKKIRGRKRQILVDTMGIFWAVKVHRANQQETTRAIEVIQNYPKHIPRFSRLLGDAGYAKNPFYGWMILNYGINPEIKTMQKQSYRQKDFQLRHRIVVSNLKPQRWIVERSFAWLNQFRRLARDYERKILNSEILLFISQIPMLLKRLAPTP